MTTPLDVRAFEAVPGQARARLRAAVDAVCGGPDTPEGLGYFCALLDDPGEGWERVAAFYRAVGRSLARDGHDPAEAHQRLRRSALAAWRAITDVVDTMELDPGSLRLVVDAQFCFLDAVSAVIADGYRAETLEAAEGVRRNRARLLALLLADPPPGPAAVVGLAAGARWPLPHRVAAVAVRSRGLTADCPLPVPDGPLVDYGLPEPIMLVPDPDGTGAGRGLEPLARDWVVAVGPTVATARAAESLRWARDTLTLARHGVIADAGLVLSAEHLPSLVVFRAGELIDYAAQARLAPLSALAPSQRDRLTETLRVLLEHNFNAVKAGQRLRVHPQTVRYRIRQLRNLFGDDLRDPGRCLEMELILHARYGAGGRLRRPVP